MLVALICIDKPDMAQTRAENRAAHLAHIADSGLVEMAGPFLEGGAMVGSLIVLRVERMEQAQDWAARDPYARAGLFARTEMREWKKVVG
jgi:uncharacterized protein